MRNHSKIDKIGICLIIPILAMISPATSMAADEKDVTILSVECEHLIQKIDLILTAKDGKKFSEQEKELVEKYIWTSLETLKLLLESHGTDEILFPNIESARLRGDARWSMIQRVNHVRMFEMAHASFDDDKIIQQLNGVKSAIVKISEFIPNQISNEIIPPSESSGKIERESDEKRD